MTKDNPADWEAVEREYRAGQLSVSEIGRVFGLSHTAINKRAKKFGWARNLTERVRQQVSDRLVSEEVSETNAETAVDAAASRIVAIVREHRKDISEGRSLVELMFDELRTGIEKRDEIEDAIEDETAKDKNPVRRSMMLKAVALPSRAGVIRDLTGALKNLVGLERQAFNMDASLDETVGGIQSLLEAIDGGSRGLPSGG